MKDKLNTIKEKLNPTRAQCVYLGAAVATVTLVAVGARMGRNYDEGVIKHVAENGKAFFTLHDGQRYVLTLVEQES